MFSRLYPTFKDNTWPQLHSPGVTSISRRSWHASALSGTFFSRPPAGTLHQKIAILSGFTQQRWLFRSRLHSTNGSLLMVLGNISNLLIGFISQHRTGGQGSIQPFQVFIPSPDPIQSSSIFGTPDMNRSNYQALFGGHVVAGFKHNNRLCNGLANRRMGKMLF